MITISDWGEWHLAEQRSLPLGEEDEQQLARELGYMSNTQTPTLFAREIEKFWTEVDAS